MVQGGTDIKYLQNGDEFETLASLEELNHQTMEKLGAQDEVALVLEGSVSLPDHVDVNGRCDQELADVFFLVSRIFRLLVYACRTEQRNRRATARYG